jgi:hypothetical protein
MVVKLVLEYDTFKNDCAADVGYMMNLERIESLPASLNDAISDAKENFRRIRDDIPPGMNGDAAAVDVVNLISRVKAQYVDLYFAEHQKRRLGINDAKRKGDLVSSTKFSNLRKLKSIGILSASKFDNIDRDLSGLKVCFELIPDMLKPNHFCTKCHFLLGESDMPVKGKLDEIEERMDNLLTEWTRTLLNTIDDPLVLDQKKYLASDQQAALDSFVNAKVIPEKIDNFFLGAIESLLQGFEPVTISANDLIDKLDTIGPCDVDTFKARVNDVMDVYTKGKDKEKLRIVIKR